MKNIGSYLAIKKFNLNDSEDVILEKIKDIFDVDDAFINKYDDEEYYAQGNNGKTYKSELEKIFYETYKKNMSLIDLKNLIYSIGNIFVDLNEDEYGDFNIVYIEDKNEITVSISLISYFM